MTSSASFNLAMQQIHPNWYDHVDAAEAAMRQSEADWAVRADYGWDGDDGGEWGPNPLQPGEPVMAWDWEDTLGLPFPEDFTASDCYVYALMETIGKYKHDPTLMAHMVALRAAAYLHGVGQPDHGAILNALRSSYVVQQASD